MQKPTHDAKQNSLINNEMLNPTRLLAHEFNNCLMIIQGNLEIAQMELNNKKDTDIAFNDKIQKRLATCLSISNQAKELIKYYLKQDSSFTKKQTILLADFLPTFIETIQPIIKRGIELKILTENNKSFIHINGEQLKGVLCNLILNAEHAIQTKLEKNKILKGEIILNVEDVNSIAENHSQTNEIKKDKAEYVKISITDNGAGIADEIRPKLFQPILSHKNNEGHGLGLFIVNDFIHENGGFIDFESELGTGTTFNLYLPKYNKK